PEVVGVEEVLKSAVMGDAVHRLDCCVISDGGGAIVLVRPEIAKTLKRPLVKIIGTGEAVKHLTGGTFNLTTSGAWRAGPIAFAEAGEAPNESQKASDQDRFFTPLHIQAEHIRFSPPLSGATIFPAAH